MLGKSGKGLQFLLARNDVLSCFDNVMKSGDVEQFRVYEVCLGFEFILAIVYCEGQDLFVVLISVDT